MAISRTQRGANTRERIIESAQALIFKQGFAGTSIDDIITDVGVTKGGFFHHFKNKADLGRAVLENYASWDYALFSGFDQRADEASDDPLESTLIFIKSFEDFIAEQPQTPPGCLFACYLYAEDNFDDDVRALIAKFFQFWERMYERRFSAILEKYSPRQSITALELSEMLMSIIEGSLVLAKCQDDASVIIRSSTQFRNYLQLLFETE